MKKTIIAIIIILVLGITTYSLLKDTGGRVATKDDIVGDQTQTDTGATSTGQTMEKEWSRQSVIGQSEDGKNIVAYQFGTGDKELLFVGGIHGGYSANTSVVAFDLIDHINDNNDFVPEGMQVTVVPVLNPDGLSSVVNFENGFKSSDVTASESEKVAARFNANDVDLNRNFDCEWQSNAKWQSKNVSGGSSAFSESESQAMRDYVNSNNPTAVVVWYSAGGGVYASSCRDGVLPETIDITDVYAKASGYKAYESYDFYATTGDMVNWLAKQKIPAISVLLTTHTSSETSKNIDGAEALVKYYSN